MEQTLERHSTGLVRRLGTFSAVMLVVGAMIGSGVFKKVAPMSAELGSGYAVLGAWIVAGLVSMCGALTNAEVACLIAEPGGQYKYFEKMYGRFFAYIYGWASFSVIQTATVASVAYVFSMSVNFIVPIPNPFPELASFNLLGFLGDPTYSVLPFENFGVKLLTIFLISSLCLINSAGLQYGSLISNIFSASVIACIVLLMLLGFGLGDGGSFTHASPTVIPTVDLTHFFTAMMAAFWAYEGWNNVGFLGGEIRNPQKNIPRALVLGVGMVMAVYVAVNAAYLYVLPIDILAGLTKVENSIAAVSVVQSLLGQGAIYLILGLIIAATFNSTNNSFMSASRVWFAMAHDGLFHASVKKTNKSDVPGNAMIVMCIWSCLLVLSGSFDQLTDMLIFASFLFYGAGAAGVFVLRKKMADAPRAYKVPLYPVLPVLFIAFCAVLVANSVYSRPREAGIGLLLILIGIPFYKKAKSEKEYVRA